MNIIKLHEVVCWCPHHGPWMPGMACGAVACGFKMIRG